MQPATIDTIKTELKQLPPKQVLELLIRLARFKKENKELLTYLLFEAGDEHGYVEQVKKQVNAEAEKLKGLSPYLYKKQFRKMQRLVNKQVKYMSSKVATIELYMHMVQLAREQKKSIFTRLFLDKTLQQYIGKIEKLLPSLDEDIAHDISRQLNR